MAGVLISFIADWLSCWPLPFGVLLRQLKNTVQRINKMPSCCSSPSEKKSKTSKRDCPTCGQQSLSVSLKTMLHHIKQPWTYHFTDEQFYFCPNTGCDVVYFSVTNKIIAQSCIRTYHQDEILLNDELVCFCFGVKKSEATVNKDIKDFVIEQTWQSMCSCEYANPSGRCCLKDFPKFK